MHNIFFLTLLILPKLLFSQVSFSEEYAELDPVKTEQNLDMPQKMEIHQFYLSEAVRRKDIKATFFGNCFLISDFMRIEDYKTAQLYILKADSVADLTNNKVWQGHVLHRKAILAIRLMNYPEALKLYTNSLYYCKVSNDYNCQAETYEQLSLLYGKLGEPGKSDSLFTLAIDMITKHGTEKQLATASNNRASILINREEYKEGIKLYKNAISIYKKLSLFKDMSKVMNNLADAYYHNEEFQKALDLVDDCIVYNESQNFKANLYINYSLKSAILETLGNYKDSKMYYEKYITLKDSLIGINVQSKVANLEKEYEVQKIKNKIIASEIKLLKSQNDNKLKLLMIMGLLLLIFTTTFIFLSKIKEGLAKLKTSKIIINNLNLEQEKDNLKISQLEMDIKKFKDRIKQNTTTIETQNNKNLFNSILTPEDWVSFKKYFEEHRPGFIFRLREEHPYLTDAEERLFLLIKINLKTSEIANVLGIAHDSVKKTRTRLRNKLRITKDEELDTYIRDY